MNSAILQAIQLIFSGNAELMQILYVTAQVSLTSSILALILGIPIGILLGQHKFFGRGILLVLSRTLMGLPPVVCGLIYYMLFSGVGPLRHWRLLFSVQAMIIAQVTLITPIVICTVESFVSSIAPSVRETVKGLRLSYPKAFSLIINESVYQIFTSYLLAFARAIAEVGAVSMVGGGIAWKTNVMTTAIMQYTNQGNFTLALALGIILLSLSLVLNVTVSLLQRRFSQ